MSCVTRYFKSSYFYSKFISITLSITQFVIFSCRIKTMVKIRSLSSQLDQMRQLAGQLKKDKDSAVQKITFIEKDIAEGQKKIQVQKTDPLDIF